MPRLLITAIKAIVLLGLLAGIYRFWRAVPPFVPPPDDDDIAVLPMVTVHAGTITRGTLHAYKGLNAVVQPQPARGLQTSASAAISSQITGIASQVFCREAQGVHAGQPLFTLDDRAAKLVINQDRDLLLAATAARAATNAAVKGGNVVPRELLRADRRLSDAQANLQAAKDRLALFTVTSPIAGVVTQLNVAAGQTVGPRAVSVEVVDTTRLTAAAAVPAWVIATISPGMPVQVELVSGSQLESATTRPALISAVVTSLDPAVDPTTGLGQVDVNLPANSVLRIGEPVRLRITTAVHKNVLIAPAQSVAEDAQGHASISGIERDFRWAIRHPVTVGLREGDRVEVSGKGIHEGMSIVTTGAQALPDETRIEVVK